MIPNVKDRYRFPKSTWLSIRELIPQGVSFGYVDVKDENYYFIDYPLLEGIHASGINLNAITQKLSGTDFVTYFESMAVYPYKIYSLLKGGKDIGDKYYKPIDIDFKSDLTVKLYKKTLPKIQGKPTSVEYYEKKYIKIENGAPVIDGFGNPVIIYENIICRIDFTLSYDPLGFLLVKVAALKWYKEDGSIDHSEFKDLGQLFDPVLDHEARIEEGKGRRTAIVNGLQLPALAFLAAFYPTKTGFERILIGQQFLNRYDEQFRDFIEKSLTVSDPKDPNFGKKVIVVEIENATDPWLDMPLGGGVTPRLYLINELAT